MKRVTQLICISTIIGLIEHIQEVGAHKTLDLFDEEEGAAEGDQFGGAYLDASAAGPDGGLFEGGEEGGARRVAEDTPLDGDFTIPPGGPQTLKDKFIAFFQHEPSWYWTHYRLELGCLAFAVVAIVHF